MKKFNYLHSVENDIRAWLRENLDLSSFLTRPALANYLWEIRETFENDITGLKNGKHGKYEKEESVAAEHVFQNMQDLLTILEENDCPIKEALYLGAFHCDAYLRHCCFSESLENVLDDFYPDTKPESWKEYNFLFLNGISKVKKGYACTDFSSGAKEETAVYSYIFFDGEYHLSKPLCVFKGENNAIKAVEYINTLL